MTTQTRKQVQPQDKWNVEALFPTLNAWEGEFSTIDWSKLASYRGRLTESAAVTREALDLFFSIARKLDKVYTYAHLRHDEEITEEDPKNAYQRAMATFYDFQQAGAWLEPELLALPAETIDLYIKSQELEPYRFHIEKIVRMSPHTLSADKEELLAMAGKPLQAASKAFGALNNADLKFDKIQDGEGNELELTHGLYQLYLRSSDRILRKNAFQQLHGKFKSFENTLAELLYGQVQDHVFQAKARNFSTSLDAALFPKNIPTSVYRSLINTVREHLPSLHRYVSLRKQILGVDELHLYDMYVPLVQEVDIQLTYDESEDLIIDSVAPLGKEYQKTLAEGLKKQRWVDRFENLNKRSGAYSSGCYDSFPYILMNYRGILRDTFTLAHEAGHSMHSFLSHKTQPYQYSHYPIFVAEVASTFNEELLMHLLLEKRTQKEERLFLINEKIEDLRATFFRQTMFAEFELTIHELVEQGKPMTPATLKELYAKLNADYFGPDAVIDEEISIEWARIPHFYYNFYVFQYATGISAAITLAEKVIVGDEQACDNYLSFLNGGCSLFPIDLLKIAGVDMTTPHPVEGALRRFDALVTEFQKLAI